jgi:DNA-directed RNA polymerase subunit RPC12/RpoP
MSVQHFKCIDCEANFTKIITSESDSAKTCPYCGSLNIENSYRGRKRSKRW